MTAHIIVTGATGFIGQHVVAGLVARGVHVTAVARHITRLRTPVAQAISWDMAQGGHGLLQKTGMPDTLLHLAWGGLPLYGHSRHVTEELPVQEAFLQYFLNAGLKHLVVSGTCFEYGLQGGALHEDMPCQPVLPYGQAKVALHKRLVQQQAKQDFALTWARLFYLWGEGQAEHSLYPQLMAAIANGNAEFPMSWGEQERDYLPVAEAARMLASLALDGRGHGAVNICSGKPVTVKALVQSWVAQHASPIALKLGHYPYHQYEPMAFWGERARFDGLTLEERCGAYA